MSALSNMFSILGLGDGDDLEQIEALSSASASSKDEVGAPKRSDKKKTNGKLLETRESQGIDKNGDGSLSLPAEEYKIPLVWIDLEMTGLNVEVDRILEIACVITDGKLAKSIEGPDLVIGQQKECLNMGEWCINNHAACGLTERVLQSTVSEKEAEKQVIDFVKEHIGPHAPLLAGNSVYVDFFFLKKYMPNLANIFPHVLIDVSSIMALCIQWFTREKKRAPLKEKRHRAMDDIKESIRELKYYKENIFKAPNKSKK